MFLYLHTACYNAGEDVDALTTNSAAQNEWLTARPGKLNVYQIQSSETVGTTFTSEVLSFVDASPGDVDVVQYVPNPIASADATGNTDLVNFLKRPTLIDARSWSTVSTVGYTGANIEPWFLYLNNSIIKQKLTNYAYLRAKLCVKVIVNATPFHFGCLRVAYEPNVNVANTGPRGTVIRANPTSALPELIPISQLPGIWLHPADNSGGYLELPFFKETNWLPLKSAIDAKNMGMLRYYIAAVLGVASSSATTNITIDTFAWLEDVELSGATAELTLQARDEYDGPISSIASAVAEASHSLESAPFIGKFARATTIGAGALADIASMFGFTNTPVITDQQPFTPMPGPVLATSEISAPLQKLTLDPKQELSVDPSLHGVGSEDEMAINYIVGQKNILSPIGWSTSDLVGVVIFNALVQPALFGAVDIMDGATNRARRVYHTYLSYLAMMFTHWRGDLIFEFEVVCTKFHKGRLKIAWDPTGSTSTAALPENVVYTTILDIGQSNKASLRIPYHSAYAFLRTRGVSVDNWSPGNALFSNSAYDNGMLIVSVLTPLVSPVSPQNLNILVSVKGASNFEFVNPRNTLAEQSTAAPPSFFAVQAKDEVSIETSDVTLGDQGTQHPERYALNFGESIKSLRTVAHRMTLNEVSAPSDNAFSQFAIWTKSISRHPPMYGFDPNGKSTANKTFTAGGTAPFNFTQTHPLTYISMMYGAVRGSVHFSANCGADLTPYVADISVSRMTTTTDNINRRGRYTSTLNSGSSQSVIAAFMNNRDTCGAGAAFTNSQTNGILSWVYPHMGPHNFNFCDPTYSNIGNPNDGTDLECNSLNVLLKQTTANTVSRTFSNTLYAGSGVDWHCIWLLACPTLDYYGAKPTGS